MSSVGDMWFTLGVKDLATTEIKKVYHALEALAGKANIAEMALGRDGKKMVSNFTTYKRVLSQIDIEIEKIRKKKLDAVKLNVDVSKLDAAEAKLQRFRDTIVSIGTGMPKQFNVVRNSVNSLTSSYDKLYSSALKAANASEKMASHSRTLSDLKAMASQYISVFGAAQLMRELVSIGGQFEQQHIALQNILGDLGQAKILFGQLKQLAVESPFTFLELSSYTKQLAAYSVPYEELYDTTKRLADMSAGLGVDMNRLILVYGQVRSAAVLRGQELRQFTEAGIPMVQKLAEKFTELNGKLVTTGDVFELISRRKVPFEMVKEILFEMTDEGGQFYNMQAKLTDTTLGQAQKLKDSWEVMLGTLSDSNNATGALLKVILGSLSYVVSNLSEIAPFLMAYGGGVLFRNVKNKFATGAFAQMKSSRINELDTMVSSSIAASSHREKAYVYKELIEAKKLNAEKLRTLYLDGKISKNMVGRLVAAKAITKEQKLSITHASKFQLAMDKTRLVVATIGKSIKSFFVSNAPLFIISAIAEVISSFVNKMMEFNDITKKVSEQSLDAFHRLENLEISKSGTLEGIMQIKNALSEIYDVSYVEKYISKLDGVQEQYKAWLDVLKGVKDAQKALQDESLVKRLQEATTSGFSSWMGFSMFSETFKEQFESVAKDIDNIKEKSINTTVKIGKKAIDAAISSAFASSKDLKDQLDKLQTGAEKIAYIMATGNYTKGFAKALADNGASEDDLWGLERIKTRYWYKLSPDVTQLENSFRKGLKEYDKHLVDSGEKSFYDKDINKMAKKWDKLSLDERANIQNAVKGMLEEIGQGRQDIINMLVAPFNVKVPIYVVPEMKNNPMDQLQEFQKTYAYRYLRGNLPNDANKQGKLLAKEFQDALSRAKTVPTTYVEFAKQTNEEWNAQREKKKYYQGLLAKDGLDDKSINNAKENIADAEEAIARCESEAKDFGFALEDTLDKTKKNADATDKWLKSFNKLTSNYERFYSNYEKYRSLYGENAARSRMKKENAPDFVFDKESLYQRQLNALKKAGLTTEDRKAKYLELQTKLTDALWEKESRQVKDRIAAVAKELEIIKEQYDNYKKIKELTGNTKLAASLTGAVENTALADALKKELAAALKKSGSAYSSEEAIKMTESQREEKLGTDNGILEILKQIDENNSAIRKENFDIMVKAIESALTYKQKADAENLSYKTSMEVINTIQDEELRKSSLAALEQTHLANQSKLIWEEFKSKPEYAQAFEDTDNLGIKTIESLVKELEKRVSKVKDSPESMKALQNSLDKLRDAQLARNPFGSIYTEFSNRQNAQNALNYLNKEYSGAEPGEKLDLDKDYGVNLPKNKKVSKIDVQNELKKSESNFIKSLNNCSDVISNFGSAFKPLIDLLGGDGGALNAITSTFEQFSTTESGVKGMGDALSGLGGLLTKGEGGGILGSIGGALSSASPYIAAGMAALNLGSKIFGSLFKNEEMEQYQKMVEYLEDLRNIVSDIKSDLAEDINMTRSAEQSSKAYKEWVALQKDLMQSERDTAGKYLSGNGGGTFSNSIEHRMNEWIDDAWGNKGKSGDIWKTIRAALSKNGMGYNGSSFDVGDLWKLSSEQLSYIKKYYYDTVWANLTDEYRTYLDNIISYGEEMREMEIQRIEALTGMTFDNLQSEWVDFLATMKADTSDFETSFEETIRKVMLNDLIYDDFKSELEKLLSDIADSRENGTFEEEYEGFKKRYLDLVETAKEGAEEINEAFGWIIDEFENMSFDNIQSEWTSMLSSLDYSNRDFAESFENYVKQAIISSLIYDTYKGRIEALVKEMNEARNNGTFDENYQKYKKAYEDMMKEAASDVEDLSKMYGWSSSKSSSLSSGIQSVTEDTADLFTSYVNAIRADVSIIRELMPNINENVIKMQADIAAINANTFRSAVSTESIENIINQVVIGTKKFHMA